MTNARSVLPTDLITLVSSGRASKNEAWPRERVYANEASLKPVGTIFDRFVGRARGRGAWICTKHQHFFGLAGARRRGGRRAWEIDYLTDMSPGQDALPYLLDCAVSEAGRLGAEKLFLRIRADSPLLSAVMQNGFTAYQSETLYLHASPTLPVRTAIGLRALRPADMYLVYRLYNTNTPEAVRRSEAATFGEWQAAHESRWLKNGVSLIEESSGEVATAVRAALFGKSLCLDVLAAEPAETDVIGLASAAAQALHTSLGSIQTLVPSSAFGFSTRLAEAGFEPAADYTVLMRRTTVPLALPKLKAVVAKSAVRA